MDQFHWGAFIIVRAKELLTVTINERLTILAGPILDGAVPERMRKDYGVACGHAELNCTRAAGRFSDPLRRKGDKMATRDNDKIPGFLDR